VEVTILTADTIPGVMAHFQDEKHLPEFLSDIKNDLETESTNALDFSDVRGQETARRVLEIAAEPPQVFTAGLLSRSR